MDPNCSGYMREIIAAEVAKDTISYNEAVLSKTNEDYCKWIQKKDSWGGAIEISILCSFYGIEMCVVDISNSIINRFGEDKDYGSRSFLLFDGIHYDPLYLESFTVSLNSVKKKNKFFYCLFIEWFKKDYIFK